MSLTQENAPVFDYTEWEQFHKIRHDNREKSYSTFLLKYLSPFVRCFLCNKPEAKITHSYNHTEHYRKLTAHSRTNNTRLYFSPMYFQLEYIGQCHKQGMVGFPRRHPVPRSNANTAVNNSVEAEANCQLNFHPKKVICSSQ